MGYTIKIVRELNIPVIMQYQSHTPDAKKNICPSSFPFSPQALGILSHALGSASTTPVVRSSPSTLGAYPLSFSSLPSPQFSPSSPHPSPVLASLPIPPPPPLPSLFTLLASLHSLLLHLRQVAQYSVPCPFLTDIACHYVSLCRSLIFLPPPSFLFPSATGESTWDPEVFIIIIIICPFWWLSFNKHSIWWHV